MRSNFFSYIYSDIRTSLDYHIVIGTVCRPFIDDDWGNRLTPKDLVSNAERDINTLMRLYYLRHGFAETDVYLVSPLSKLGFMSLNRLTDQLSPRELEYTRATLFLALKGLCNQGRNYIVARTVYRIIRSQLRPEETQIFQGLEDISQEPEGTMSLAKEISAAWTPGIMNITDDPVSQELSKLAKQYLVDSDE